MDNIFPLFSALWLGILTSISPCPLATNIAATTYISKKINGKYYLIFSSFFYALGRSFVYIVLCIFIIIGIASISIISNTLQLFMNTIIGPILIIAGLYMLQIIKFSLINIEFSYSFKKKFADSGIIGSFILGGLFALSFCPVSAALFFGSVIPLSMQYSSSSIIIPIFYGTGTAIPVIIAAIIISYSSHLAGIFFNKLTTIEKYLRIITAIIFIIIGLNFSFKYLL